MDFSIQYLSFYVIQVEGQGEQADKTFKHFQTLDQAEYVNSSLKDFLDGELMKIAKRKVDRHPKTDQAPTKIGYFIVEEGYDSDSNPHFNLFNRVRFAETKEAFQSENEQFIRTYLDTSAVRGGVFLIATAKLNEYFDEPFVFLMKCDFEPKVASISDETTLIRHVEMAITTKNMKSIQYPYMPQEGMIEENELKIHQASHARYFEDFLKFVAYGESMPVIMKTQVMNMVQEHVTEMFEDQSEELIQFEKEMEIWEASDKREIQERLTTPQVIEATAQIVEHTPEAELSMKVGSTSVKGLLADFGDTIHLGKINGKYVLLLEADSIQFEKGVSPIEFHKPDDLQTIIAKIINKN